MSTEEEFLQRIRLRPSLMQLMQERSPAETEAHITDRIGDGGMEYHLTLADLYILTGRLEDASACVSHLEQQMPPAMRTCKIYHDLIEADRWRQAWHLNGKRAPASFVKPSPHIRLRCRGWHEYLQLTVPDAVKCIRKANRQRHPVAGVLENDRNDTQRFDDVRESHSFLSDTLEVLAPKRFFLVPFEHVKRLELPQVEAHRQFAYVTCRIVTNAGQNGVVWVPQYYAGTHLCESDESRAGRVTSWDEVDDDVFVAAGPRKLQFRCGDSIYLLGLDQICRIAFSTGNQPTAKDTTNGDG